MPVPDRSCLGICSVSSDSDIVLTFSEQILRGTGNIVFTPLGETSQNYDAPRWLTALTWACCLGVASGAVG